MTQFATPIVLKDLIHHGFLNEIAIACSITSLMMLCLFGLMQKGFKRYLAYMVSSSILISTGLFIAGYFIFSWLFLEEIHSLLGLIDLANLHYQNLELWSAFIKTEGALFLISFIALGLYLFNKIRPEK
ncbi:hypothetical protein [Legionella sp. km772]|uniref:hypothetical protein n=1 Tax=Legionella sp. km772 TaxID=2498111 RepID=UPI001F4063FC|nr:hypothetical protein [Legionella sp. km772]